MPASGQRTPEPPKRMPANLISPSDRTHPSPLIVALGKVAAQNLLGVEATLASMADACTTIAARRWS